MMNKKIKILVMALLALLALAVAGIWYAASSIDQFKLTRLLGATVKDATGRDLKISGPIGLTFFPAIGVLAQDVTLSNADWASDPEMVRVKRVELEVKLLPLLSKRVEISRINISGIEVHLQSNSGGIGNWVLAAPLVQGNSAQTSSPGRDSNTFVAIESSTVTDARIIYRDPSGSVKTYEIAQLSLRGDGGNTNIKLDVKLGNIQLGVDGKITKIRKIFNDWDLHPLKIEMNLNLELNGKVLSVKGDIQKQSKAAPIFDVELSSKSFDLAPLASASALATSGGGLPATAARTQAPSPYFFSDMSIPFNLLPEARGRVGVNINQLGLPNYAPLKNVTALFQFENEQIDLQNLNFQIGSSSAQAQASIVKFHSGIPKVSFRGQANGYSLEQVLKTADGSSKVSGGDTQIAFDLKGSGVSLHQLMGSSTGKVQIYLSQAKLPSSYINKGGNFVISLFDAINPLRKNLDQTVLECAAAYLPVNNGLVNVADSVRVQTDRLNVVLSGTVNLNTEVINLNIYPREKSGLTIGLDLANLVKLQGTLQNPTVGLNKAGVMNSAVSIGLGLFTAGASILAENAKSMTTKLQPCKVVLHPWSDIYPRIQ